MPTRKGYRIFFIIIITVLVVLIAMSLYMNRGIHVITESTNSYVPQPAKESTSSCFDIKVNKFSTDEYGYYQVIGVAKNISDRTFKFVQVQAEYLNKNKAVVGQETTYVTGTDYLLPGATKSFKFMGENQTDYKSVRVSFESAREVE